MYVGVTNGAEGKRAELKPYELHAWENKVTYHERLKSSYYVLQKLWRDEQ
jgi:hypothetical protein